VATAPAYAQAQTQAPAESEAKAPAQPPGALADLDADYGQYQQGLKALDNLEWDKAVSSFQGMSAASQQTEGALYWKAFALYRAGKGKDALQPLADLRKSFPQSGWMRDAKSLETAITEDAPAEGAAKKETAAQRQKAIEDRIAADAAHAPATLRAAAFGIDLPGVRQKALYFLSKENSKGAKDIVLEAARGGANPDLQAYAISQLGRSDPQAAYDLYPAVEQVAKGMILSVLSWDRDSAGLMKIAAAEMSDDLRFQALSCLVQVGTDAQVKQALEFENAADVKMLIATRLNNVHKWVQEQITTLRTSTDARERRIAAVGLTMGGEASTDRALVEAYPTEKDPDVKGAIVFALGERRNYSALEAIEKNETDSGLKLRLGMALDAARNK